MEVSSTRIVNEMNVRFYGQINTFHYHCHSGAVKFSHSTKYKTKIEF